MTFDAAKAKIRLHASAVDGRLELVAVSADGSAALGLNAYTRDELDEALERGHLLAIVFDADFEDARV